MKAEDILPGIFDILASVKAQANYCNENDLLLSAPAGGYCWMCEANIYSPITGFNDHISGITVDRAGKEHIIRCPHCNINFIGS